MKEARRDLVTIEYRISPPVDDADLNRLFAAAWNGHRERPIGPVLARSLVYVCAYEDGRLVGFVNVAWDGGVHGFVLDTTVAPGCQHRGVGTELVRRAAQRATDAGLEWLHVDYEPHLDSFYRGCGFCPTAAGLLPLSRRAQ
jgi:GNAT superfamily N-acetyltransferase